MTDAAENTDDAEVILTDDDGKVIDTAEGEAGGEAQDSAEAIATASLMGWKPKDQWRGDLTNWKPASAFLVDTPEVMRSMRKKIERQDGTLTRVVAQLSKLDANQRRQHDDDLDAALDAAIDAGDKTEAKRIRDAIRAGASAPAANDAPPELAAFEDRNSAWLGVNPDATAMVKVLDARFATETGGVKDPEKHLKRIETEIKKRFPELFEAGEGSDDGRGGKRSDPPVLGRGSRTPGRSSPDGKITVADMTPAQRRGAKEVGVSEADWVKNFNIWTAQERRA